MKTIVIMKAQASHWPGWLVTTGCGLLAGVLLGIGMSASHTHAMWPVIAGLIIGMVATVTAKSIPVLVALAGGIIAVTASVATVAFHQYHIGYWPIRDEFTIAHYGTSEMAMMRLAVILFFLICGPCVLTAALGMWARRSKGKHDDGIQSVKAEQSQPQPKNQ